MVEPLTTQQSDNYKLLPDTIKTIEKIINSGDNARITTGRDGLTVYREKVKKLCTQS